MVTSRIRQAKPANQGPVGGKPTSSGVRPFVSTIRPEHRGALVGAQREVGEWQKPAKLARRRSPEKWKENESAARVNLGQFWVLSEEGSGSDLGMDSGMGSGLGVDSSPMELGLVPGKSPGPVDQIMQDGTGPLKRARSPAHLELAQESKACADSARGGPARAPSTLPRPDRAASPRPLPALLAPPELIKMPGATQMARVDSGLTGGEVPVAPAAGGGS